MLGWETLDSTPNMYIFIYVFYVWDWYIWTQNCGWIPSQNHLLAIQSTPKKRRLLGLPATASSPPWSNYPIEQILGDIISEGAGNYESGGQRIWISGLHYEGAMFKPSPWEKEECL